MLKFYVSRSGNRSCWSTSTNTSESNHKILIPLWHFAFVLGYELVFSPFGLCFSKILWGNLAIVRSICLKLSDNGKYKRVLIMSRGRREEEYL